MVKRPDSPPKPEGSGRKPFRLTARTPEKAISLMRGKFKRIERFLKKEFPVPRARKGKPIPPRPFSLEFVPYKKSDDSVTADLRIMAINPKVNIDDLLMALHRGLDGTAVNGVWLSIGFYNPPSVAIESEEGYRRTQGMIFYRTFSRRWTKQHAVLIVEQSRESQDAFKRAHDDVRPLGVVVRGWWNPEGRRPRYKLKVGDEDE